MYNLQDDKERVTKAKYAISLLVNIRGKESIRELHLTFWEYLGQECS